MRLTALIAALAALALALDLPAAAAGFQTAPGSQVEIDLPDGWLPAERFSGFQHTATGASIVVLQAPAGVYRQMADGFTPEGLARRGVIGAKALKLPRGDTHIALEAKQATPAGDFSKLFVLFQGLTNTVLVSANLPADALAAGTLRREAVIEAINSARLSLEAQPAVLLFTLGYLGRLKEAGVVLGTARIYNLSGKLPTSIVTTPDASFIVAPSTDRQPTGPLAELAQRLLRSTFKEPVLGAGEPVSIDGLEGIAHSGSATNPNSGLTEHFYHVLLAGQDGGYFRLIGMSSEPDGVARLDEMRRIAASFRRELAKP